MSSKMQRLGTAVRARRRDLGLAQEAVTDAGGPSNTTLTGIENGVAETVSPATLRKLDHALRWTEGSARHLYEDGTAPTPLPDRVALTREHDPLAKASDVALLAELARRLDRAKGTGEPDEQSAPTKAVDPEVTPRRREVRTSRSRVKDKA